MQCGAVQWVAGYRSNILLPMASSPSWRAAMVMPLMLCGWGEDWRFMHTLAATHEWVAWVVSREL